jgi:uncharacterized membrane protein
MPIPTTISEYLAQLNAALADADPALRQDALYDAEEYLRSELAEHPEWDEATMLSHVATSYGAPDEVADIYRDKEVQVESALRAPSKPTSRTSWGKFFGVLADPLAYSSLFYMILSLATGIFYFAWVVTGLSLSLGLCILIIGLPFAALFISTVRALALMEGRLIETMLGERMPRRPLYADRGKPFMGRVKAMFTDPRTWSTLLYMIIRLPLGMLYFTLAVMGLAFSISIPLSPITYALFGIGLINVNTHHFAPPLWTEPLLIALGILMLSATLHLARGIGRMQGTMAKRFLVKTAQY